MFSPLEAAAYKGQLPEQKGQNAVNPQLKNLFAIQSAMEAKKHADEQLAAALGQQTQSQPTVAAGLQQAAEQALQPETQSPREVATQNMGLPGLMQGGQGQPPQGRPPQAPMGQPPQAQAPQQMASGGLAGARSNLPASYAGGGIVAFDAGGPTSAEGSPTSDGVAPDMLTSVKDIFEKLIAKGVERSTAADMARKYVTTPIRQALKDFARPAPVTSSTEEGMAGYTPPTRYVEPVAPEAAAAAPVAEPRARPPVAAAPAAAAPAAPSGLAGLAGLEKAMTANLEKRITAKPEDAEAAEAAKYEAALGEGQRANIAAQQGGIDKLAALQAAKASNRPSQFWETINAIGAKGSNVLPGQWGSGVAGAVQKAREGYADEDIANQTKINTLINAMNKAKDENNIGKYNVTREAAIKAVADTGMATKDAVTLIDSREKTEQMREANRLTNKTRMDQANQHAATLVANLKDRGDDRAASRLSHSHEIAMRQATDAANKFSADLVAGVMRKGETRSSVFNDSYEEAMSKTPGYVPIAKVPAAAAAPGTIPTTRMQFDAKGNPIR